MMDDPCALIAGNAYTFSKVYSWHRRYDVTCRISKKLAKSVGHLHFATTPFRQILRIFVMLAQFIAFKIDSTPLGLVTAFAGIPPDVVLKRRSELILTFTPRQDWSNTCTR